MSTAVFMHREGQIRQWFSMWLDKQDTGIGDLFAPDVVYIERAFRCAMTNDTVQSFDGLSLIRWNKAGQICFLQEFGCNENRYDPYTQGKTPVFREEQALWL